jgi:hypothetical protein
METYFNIQPFPDWVRVDTIIHNELTGHISKIVSLGLIKANTQSLPVPIA